MPFTDAILGFAFYPALPFERISFLPHSGFAVRLFSAIRHKINETPRASLLDAIQSWIQFGSAPREDPCAGFRSQPSTGFKATNLGSDQPIVECANGPSRLTA
jgi:hypothetical protein